jgi:uncharacterized protein Yka (UPF0111/DUF47 family)
MIDYTEQRECRMIDYTEQAVVVDTLRYCANTLVCGQKQCPAYYDRSDDCFGDLLRDAANMIEAKHQLIEELRQETAEKDKEIEDLKREIMSYPAEEAEREERCGL